MLQQHVLPSVRAADEKHALLPDLGAAVITLKEALQVSHLQQCVHGLSGKKAESFKAFCYVT